MASDPIGATRSRIHLRFVRRFARALGNIPGIVEAVLLERELRREMRRLSSYDERLLKDIGLSHAEIETAVRLGRNRRASTGSPQDTLLCRAHSPVVALTHGRQCVSA